MQENQVTIEGKASPITKPFMTVATQNPVEHEGTYPLPEAQLDRFMFKVLIDYPDHDAGMATRFMSSGVTKSRFSRTAFALAARTIDIEPRGPAPRRMPDVCRVSRVIRTA